MPGQTETAQANEPGTLRQNLRDLKVADATVQLENLAREVGIELTTWHERPLAQCEGQIVSAFHELKSVYEKLRIDLLGAAGRILTLQTVLKAAPADFQYPKSALGLDKLQGRPALIENTLEDARGEEVDRLRSEFDGLARLGNFQRDLLDEPRGALTQLLGHVISVENAIAEYRKRLVENAELQKAHRGLEALARATGASTPRALTPKEVEDIGALSEARKLVSAHVQEHTVTGGKLLGDAGISFDRWCAIVSAFDAGRDPTLEPQEADALVGRNLVQRTYRLAVRS
jgi:hypothetical protein